MVLVATEPCKADVAELPSVEASSFFSFGSLPRPPALQCLLRGKSRAFLLCGLYLNLQPCTYILHACATAEKKLTTLKSREADLALLYMVKF